MAYATMTPDEAREHKPTVLFVDEHNKVVRKANYEKHGLLVEQKKRKIYADGKDHRTGRYGRYCRLQERQSGFDAH
jgi:hypothetical protein